MPGAMMAVTGPLKGGREDGTGADAPAPDQLTAARRHRGLRAFGADREAEAA